MFTHISGDPPLRRWSLLSHFSSTVHPLDGHGYLRAFTFDDVTNNVKYMAKYIKTEAHVEEHDPTTNKWKFTHRGPFSMLKGERKVGNTKVMKNVANTSVVKWGEKLLCVWESGEPYEIQAGTLVDGADLQDHNDNHGGDVWNRLLTLSCNAEDMLLPRSNFTFTEYDSNFKVVQKQNFRIPDRLMIHD